MGACVSTHHKPSAMKVQFGSNDIHLLKPTQEKPPFINGDLAAKPQWLPSQSTAAFRDFGSKEETFFDSQAWLESDCDDDFMSVNGEFTPSRGNTPVHHKFSAGANGGALFSGNNKPPVSPYQASPNAAEKKTRLSDLFKESLRGDHRSEVENGEADNNNGVKWEAESPGVSESICGEMGGNGLKTKRERVQGCFPSLLSSRSSSTNGRKMMSPRPVVG